MIKTAAKSLIENGALLLELEDGEDLTKQLSSSGTHLRIKQNISPLKISCSPPFLISISKPRPHFVQILRTVFLVSADGNANFILLSCSQDDGLNLLEAAMMAGILKPGNKIIVPCLGLATKHLEKYKYLGAEITLIKLQGSHSEDTDPQRDLLLDLLSAVNGGFLNLKLENFDFTESGSWLPSGLSCDDTRVWQNGIDLIERIRENSFVGRTGPVIFDEHGKRSNQTFNVLELGKSGVKVNAIWSEDNGLMKAQG